MADTTPEKQTREALIERLMQIGERLHEKFASETKSVTLLDQMELRGALNALRQHDVAGAQSGEVKVKPLEWLDEGWASFAYPAIGRYRIEDHGANWTDDRFWLSFNGEVLGKFGEAEPAKASAQADFERRILSTLTPHPEGEATAVADIVPAHCSGSSLVFSEGVLHVKKDGSGYIVVKEADFEIETEYDSEDGSRSDFWITRFPAGEMQALRDFLNGVRLTTPPPPVVDEYTAMAMADLQTELRRKLSADFPNHADWPVTLPAGHWRALLAAIGADTNG